MTIHWKPVEQNFTLLLNLTQFVILENLSVMDLALSGVSRYTGESISIFAGMQGGLGIVHCT